MRNWKGIKAIAEFMGFKETETNDVWLNGRKMGGHIDSGAFDYDKDWNLLMAACKKWDLLSEGRKTKKGIVFPAIASNKGYTIWSDALDNAVSCYDIVKTFNQLVQNINWLNRYGK